MENTQGLCPRLVQSIQECSSSLTEVLNESLAYQVVVAHAFIAFFWFFQTGFLCVAFGVYPGTHSGEQAGLELTEMHLPLPPKSWI